MASTTPFLGRLYLSQGHYFLTFWTAEFLVLNPIQNHLLISLKTFAGFFLCGVAANPPIFFIATWISPIFLS